MKGMSAAYSAILYLGVFFLTIHNIKNVAAKTEYSKLYMEISGRRYNTTLICRFFLTLLKRYKSGYLSCEKNQILKNLRQCQD